MQTFMWCLLALAGFSFGLLAAAGVFTVLSAVGLVPRFAGKTHSAKEIWLYEDMVMVGTIVGCICSVFHRYLQVGSWLEENFRALTGCGKRWGRDFWGYPACFTACLWGVWPWPSRRCWTVFPYLPAVSPSVTGWAAQYWPWRWANFAAHCSTSGRNCTGW